MEQETFKWFAGVDWGSEKHQVCVLDAAGLIAGEREFSHDGRGLAQLCDWIVSVVDDIGPVAVGVEVHTGLLSTHYSIAGWLCTPSIPSNSTACATDSALLARRTIGAMRM